MSAYPVSFGQIPANEPPAKRRKRWFSGKFLAISVVVHLLFGLGAAYYIVMSYAPAKVPVMKSGDGSDKGMKEIQQQVKQAAQKNSSAPAPMQRAVSVSTAPVAIPKIDYPSHSNSVQISPLTGWDGPGLSPGTGNGPGVGNGPGNGRPPFYGLTKPVTSGALKGEFYDLKLTRGKKETGITGGEYGREVSEFVSKGWNEGHLSKYLKGNQPLYATQVFLPEIDSTEAPKAFNSPAPDSPGMWIVVYRGQVMAPESGTYHFVGAGDDNIYVRFNGKLVLDNCEHIPAQIQPEGVYNYTGLRNKFVKGTGVTVEAGKYYTIEILIGDHIPRKTMAALLIEKDGVTYAKDGNAPILPPFLVGQQGDSVPSDILPAHMNNGPVWTAKKDTGSSLLDIP